MWWVRTLAALVLSVLVLAPPAAFAGGPVPGGDGAGGPAAPAAAGTGHADRISVRVLGAPADAHGVGRPAPGAGPTARPRPPAADDRSRGAGYALAGAAGEVVSGGIAVLDDPWDGRARTVRGTAGLRDGAVMTVDMAGVSQSRPWSGSWSLRDPAGGVEITAESGGDLVRPADDTVVWTGPARVHPPGEPAGAGAARTVELTIVDGTADAGDHLVWLRHAGVERQAVVHVPAGPTAGARPALFHFPGMFESPAMANESGRLSRSADQEGYLLVIPAHRGVGWQGVPGGEESPRVDDPGFVRRLVDEVIARFGADPSRIYASGASNGGLFTQLLACRDHDRFAAFATVAGSAPGAGCPVPPPAHLRGTGPAASGGPAGSGASAGSGAAAPAGGAGGVPMVILHGTKDRIIRYAEASAGADYWARAARCALTSVDTVLPDTDRRDGTTVIRHSFVGCSPAYPVVLYEIVGGGHTRPGGASLFPAEILGRISGDLDANQVIWDFVSRFRLSA